MSERLTAGQPPKPSGGRISALFKRGKMVIFGEDESGPVVGWVQALTRTQREEALLAGAMAGARTRLLYVPGYPDYDVLVEHIATMSKEEIVDGVIAATEMAEIWALAEKDLHADESWREGNRLQLIRDGDELINSGVELSGEEAAALADLNLEYQITWRKYANERIGVRQQELLQERVGELTERYVDAAVSLRTMDRQSREYNLAATHHALRRCSATQREDGSFDHSACGSHSERQYQEIAEVREEADEVIDAVVTALSDLDVAASSLGGSERREAQVS